MSRPEAVIGVRAVVGDAARCRSGMIEFAVLSPLSATVGFAVNAGMLDMIGNGVARVTEAGRALVASPFRLQHDRCYIDREGTVHHVLEIMPRSGSRFDFESTSELFLYMEDGRYVEIKSTLSSLDLIDEAPGDQHIFRIRPFDTLDTRHSADAPGQGLGRL